MNKTRLLEIVLATSGVLLVFCGFAVAAASAQDDPSPLPSTLTGVVLDENGPVAGAIVQMQAMPKQVQTAEDGSFIFDGVEGNAPAILTAWADRHYVGWVTLDPTAPDWNNGADLTITLRPLSETDNSDYEWFSFEGVEGSAACGLCHREYTEWQEDAHAHAATNERFLTVYTGMDVNGQQGQWTQMGLTGALPPNPDKPYYGPGFLLDNPGRAGNCATCHTPLASNAPNTQNCAWSGCHTNLTIERANGLIKQPAIPVNLHGDAAEGVSCEFCHKVSDVTIDPETGLPPPDMPGILSMTLRRPSDDSQQIFFGTLVDVPRRDTYLPLLSDSEFCAPCHFGVMGGVVGMGEVTGGTVIYNSYGEWLDSPYSDPDTGKTCQECHMPVSSAKWFVTAERGGMTRDYQALHDHTMLGVTDEVLMQNSVSMTAEASYVGDQLQVQVSITNDKTGHDVPSDAPMRSMILVVEARDADGNLLALSEGPVNPDYSGEYGGLPGKTFAKVLRDEWTGETPTSAIWRPVTIVEDTRLEALATDTTSYRFDVASGQAVAVDVRLVFRRAFATLMQQKGWNDPDILMEHETLQVPAN